LNHGSSVGVEGNAVDAGYLLGKRDDYLLDFFGRLETAGEGVSIMLSAIRLVAKQSEHNVSVADADKEEAIDLSA